MKTVKTPKTRKSTKDAALDEIELLKEDVAQLKKTLYIGNGTPALTARMTKAETDIQTSKDQLKEIKSGQTWIIRLVITNLVTGIGAYLPKLVSFLGTLN